MSHELDCKIHKALGYKLLTPDDMLAEAREVWKTQPNCTRFIRGFRLIDGTPENPVLQQQVERYSTDWNYAMKAAERLGMTKVQKHTDRTFYVGVGWNNFWSCGYIIPRYLKGDPGQEGWDYEVIGIGASGPEAICQAILALKGVTL